MHIKVIFKALINEKNHARVIKLILLSKKKVG